MCLLSLLGAPDEEQLTAALAEVLSVPVESVDVHDDETIERNWQAPVLCTVLAFDGELRMQLDISLREGVSRRPSTEVLAAEVAGRLGCAVAYDLEVRTLPCYYWIVGTDGRRTRADISEDYREDDEPPFHRIDAVEHPVAGAPGLPIAAIPGVINDYRMPTPLTDGFREALESVPDGWKAVDRIGAWEAMVTRLERGWPPDGWFPAEEYQTRLDCRDELATLADDVPALLRAEFDEALATLDRRFTEATVDDGGQALTSRVGPIPDRWWWHRITQPLPWHHMPGEGR